MSQTELFGSSSRPVDRRSTLLYRTAFNIQVNTMSWDAYRDNLIASGNCHLAAVVGAEDGRVWSQSPGMSVRNSKTKITQRLLFYHDHVYVQQSSNYSERPTAKKIPIMGQTAAYNKSILYLKISSYIRLEEKKHLPGDR